MSRKTQKSKPKWRRRAEARPDEVLDAALDLFIRHGFAATRVEDITRAAGLSKGAVYLYFDSKVAILEALVRRSIIPVAQHAEQMAKTHRDDPKLALTLMINTVAQRMSDPKVSAIPRLIIAEAGNFPELVKMYREEVIDRAFSALETLIRTGIEMKIFRSVNPQLAVRNIIGPMLVHILFASVFGVKGNEYDDPREFIKSHLDILFNGLAESGVAS
jgi:AcrR family transcriptional regulator